MRIELEAVSFRYPGGVQALRAVDLSIAANESVALVGENGAGKTTLVKHLNGLLKPDSGRVLIGDWDTAEHSVARLASRVGLAFQNPDDQLFARTVQDEVAFGPRNLGRSDDVVEESVAKALKQVGLAAMADHHPYDLALPERKLVALAAVLAMDTPVVVLDEPTLGQDARGIERLGQIVGALKAGGRTVVTISHDIDFCADHFERVVVLAGGRVTAAGPAGEVLTQETLLAGSQLEPPQLVRLAAELRLPQRPLSTTAFLEALKQRKNSHDPGPG